MGRKVDFGREGSGTGSGGRGGCARDAGGMVEVAVTIEEGFSGDGVVEVDVVLRRCHCENECMGFEEEEDEVGKKERRREERERE